MSEKQLSGRQIKELFYTEGETDENGRVTFRCRCGNLRAQSLKHGYTNLKQHVAIKHPEWLAAEREQRDVGPAVALALRPTPSAEEKSAARKLKREKRAAESAAKQQAAPALTINDAAVPLSAADMTEPESAAAGAAGAVQKRTNYLSWDDYFMSVAFLSAMRSKDPSTQYREPREEDRRHWVQWLSERLQRRRAAVGSLQHERQPPRHQYVCHAEMNAILNKNSTDVKGCTIYVALFPCNECAKLIIQFAASRRLLDMAQVRWDPLVGSERGGGGACRVWLSRGCSLYCSGRLSRDLRTRVCVCVKVTYHKHNLKISELMINFALTRLEAEAKHAKLKSSLARASAEFREQFKDETELFRSLPLPPQSPTAALESGAPPASRPAAAGASPVALATAQPLSASAGPPLLASRALSDDLVRAERLVQCCKRVRVWRRQIANPLLQYRSQLLSPATTSGKPGAKKSDRRMHITLLMALIVDMYEQRMHFEVEESESLVIQEAFPEFVVRAVSQRTSNRRAAADQLASITATVLHAAATHQRVRVFGSLCGLDDAFNPPERIKVFLHVLERLHRWKASSSGAGAGGNSVGKASALTMTRPTAAGAESADAAMSTVVFHTIGVPQQVVQKLVVDLFQEDYYWNFQFWHTQFSELRVDYRWPVRACEELIERALGLAVSSRNALLNTMRKIDGDALLSLLLDVWTERAKALCALLEAATDREEAKSTRSLQERQQLQDARATVLPLSEREAQVFDELVDEFWNADVPWASPAVQRKLAPVAHVRPLHELWGLFRDYVLALDESRKSWDWQKRWRWEPEWEWGVLHLQDS
ncbi:hypothetical protein PybrP1_003419 [[Pythium] brassicae (nom. inval.)]|nr:hypothetical protein PybrP1_003419 [[Pythium] brassicae (nom. inval.)]